MKKVFAILLILPAFCFAPKQKSNNKKPIVTVVNQNQQVIGSVKFTGSKQRCCDLLETIGDAHKKNTMLFIQPMKNGAPQVFTYQDYTKILGFKLINALKNTKTVHVKLLNLPE